MSGKVCIVTGANTGVGLSTATVMADKGYDVILACRREEAGDKAVRSIKSKNANARVTFMKLDLASKNSIEEFTNTFLASRRKLHVLVNNAGVFPNIGNKSPKFTEDGFEEAFGINHLGHMYLTLLLLQLLKESTPSRIVMVSSELHDPNTKSGFKKRKPHIDFENLQLLEPNTFNSLLAYSNSKLANILFATELSSRLPTRTGVTINSVTPGWIPKINLGNPGCFFHCLLVCCFHYCCRCCKITRTLEEGTDCIVKVATDPSLQDVTGKYYKDCKETESSDESRDARVARALWKESLNLLGLTRNPSVLLALK